MGNVVGCAAGARAPLPFEFRTLGGSAEANGVLSCRREKSIRSFLLF